MSLRRRLRLLVVVLSLAAPAPALAHAGTRPTDAIGAVCTYRVPEAPPYDTPQGHVRVHYVADPASGDSPALTSTRVVGVPDWIVSTGEAAEIALARETALGFPAPPPDDGDGNERGGDGRYDIYVCDIASPGLGELAATVADPPGSGFSSIVVDNDYTRSEVAPLANAGLDQLRVSLAHEVFHAIQIGAGRGRMPEWLAESTAVWMEGTIVPPDIDREIYRVALGGSGTETPYWRGGGLHEYGAWWLIDELERAHPGFVRRLVALSATRGDDDPDGLQLAARALGSRRSLESAFRRFARAALDDPLVGRSLRARRAGRLRPGGRIVLRASVEPLSLRLWRVPTTATAVTVTRAGSQGLGAVVRRGSLERALPRGVVQIPGGQGSVLVLAIGGAGNAHGIRVTLTA
jgi:hypothetical protein